MFKEHLKLIYENRGNKNERNVCFANTFVIHLPTAVCTFNSNLSTNN